MLLFLAGCLLDAEKPAVEDSAPLGSGEAYGCIESARVPIVDRTVAAEGMSAAPDDIGAVLLGGWSGTFTFVSGDAQAATFSVTPGGSWELIQRTLYEGGGMSEGAPAEECGPLYAWTTTAALADASGALDELVPVVIEATTPWSASLIGAIPLEEVTGTTRPTAWDPFAWDANELVLSGTATALDISGSPAPGTWEVSVLWQASNETESYGAASADGASDTATVEPSGMTEGVGSGTFAPD